MSETAPCPKCGFPNRRETEKCANCFAPLKAPPAPTMEEQRIRPKVKPPFAPQPVKSGFNVGWIVIALLLALGAGGGTMMLINNNRAKVSPKPSVPAEVVAEKFLQAKQGYEVAKVKPYLSAASIEKLDKSFSSRAARSAGFDKAEVAKMFLFDADPSKDDLLHSKVTVARPANVDTEKNQAVVSVKLEREGGKILGNMTFQHELVMVNEGGNWKVDLDLTSMKNGGGGFGLPLPGGAR